MVIFTEWMDNTNDRMHKMAKEILKLQNERTDDMSNSPYNCQASDWEKNRVIEDDSKESMNKKYYTDDKSCRRRYFEETMDSKSTLSMVPPWIRYAKLLEIMFNDDPDIEVFYNDVIDETCIMTVNMRIKKQNKVDALEKIFKKDKVIGVITVHVNIIPANLSESEDLISQFKVLFDGNPIVSKVISQESKQGVPFAGTYVVFKNKVVQFYNDILSDPNGNESTLYEYIAREVFDDIPGGLFFATDTPTKYVYGISNEKNKSIPIE